jgi:AraC-like DNA-binding protein
MKKHRGYSHFNNESGFLSLYISKGQLCFQMKQLDSARIYLERAQEVANKYHSNELEAILYQNLSDLYAAQGRYKEAFIAHRKYEQLNDSLIAERYEAGTMDILAEKNYEHYNAKIATYRREVKTLVFGLSIFALLLGVILALYFKLSYSHQQLVRKSIALDGAAPAPLAPQAEGDAGTANTPRTEARPEPSGTPAEAMQEHAEAADLDSSATTDLIHRLTAFLEKDRGFMNADLTLQDVADHLGTNRTYVSRAVNAVFKTNFSTYLNELRIKEAIRLISLGEHKALSIEGLASAVGFNNRKSFGSAFQKYTGVSPSGFIKNYDRLK